jgi:flagellar basal-body rod modification protein FlgD
MDTSAVGATTTTTQTKATTRGFDDMGSEDFFKLLISELQNQDPMKPTDNQQLMSQLSTIRQMQQTTTLNTTLQTLAAQERFGSTTGLIGQYVAGTVTNDAGASASIEGLVTSVSFNSKGEAMLELHNGKSLPAANVEEVTVVDNLPASVRQQLQAELAAANSASTASARLISPWSTASSKVNSAAASGNKVNSATQKADTTANLLDALMIPEIGL